VDAAHFVFKAYLGFVWCFTRLIIRSPSGRKRFNVLGALNAITHQLITVTNETYITAESVCELLQKIAALGIEVPITLILDNTRYQRCAKVMDGRSIADRTAVLAAVFAESEPDRALMALCEKAVPVREVLRGLCPIQAGD
jgi:hypothetical protein